MHTIHVLARTPTAPPPPNTLAPGTTPQSTKTSAKMTTKTVTKAATKTTKTQTERIRGAAITPSPSTIGPPPLMLPD